MLTIDDVAAYTQLRNAFDPTSLDYRIADFFVQNPAALAGEIQQNQLQSVVNSCPDGAAAKPSQALINYYGGLL